MKSILKIFNKKKVVKIKGVNATTHLLRKYYEVKPCEKMNLTSPRIEIRWRDAEYIRELDSNMLEFLRKANPLVEPHVTNYICDLCLVINNVMGEQEYLRLSSSMSDRKDANASFYVPGRMLQDTYNLMYELHQKAYVSYGNNYQELVFPKDLSEISMGLKSKMNKVPEIN